jgi:general secretion pathway protein J
MMRSSTRNTQNGFTLLELLIAIAIFAIVGILAMSGYNQLLRQREHAAETMARIRAVQRTVVRLTQDFGQLEPRPIRDATAASVQPALSFNTTGTYVIEFTRSGWTNPAGINRSTLQRVGYRLVDGKLYRDYWTVLDRTLSNPPVQTQLLDKVTTFSLRFMDTNHQWQTSWPVSTGTTRTTTPTTTVRPRALPLAVEITLTLQDWGDIKRIVETTG